MGFMTRESQRLRRTGWNSLQEAMDEVYAVFQADGPLVVDGGLVINNNTTEPGITINQGGHVNTAITINSTPGEDPGSPGPGDPPDVYNFTTNIYIDGSMEGFDDTDPDEPVTPGEGEPVGGGGGGFPAEVVSGSGFTYTCNIYTSGLGTTPISASVRLLGMSSSASVPVGTQFVANRVGNSYVGYVACWL